MRTFTIAAIIMVLVSGGGFADDSILVGPSEVVREILPVGARELSKRFTSRPNEPFDTDSPEVSKNTDNVEATIDPVSDHSITFNL